MVHAARPSTTRSLRAGRDAVGQRGAWGAAAQLHATAGTAEAGVGQVERGGAGRGVPRRRKIFVS